MSQLTDQERLAAAARGWLVCDIYDLETQRVTVSVLPTAGNACKSAQTLQAYIFKLAPLDALAGRIVQHMTHANMPSQQPKRKSK